MDISRSMITEPNNSYSYPNRSLVNIEDKGLVLACRDLQNALNLGFTEKYGR